MRHFKLSKRSQAQLIGVHPDLQRMVEVALTETSIDFGVLEGLRTMARQRQFVESKASKSLNSRHLTGHAVDLGAYIGRELRWDAGLYYPIAHAMAVAASSLKTSIRWGGCWTVIKPSTDLNKAVYNYVARCKAAGTKPLIDLGHFELPRDRYPA